MVMAAVSTSTTGSFTSSVGSSYKHGLLRMRTVGLESAQFGCWLSVSARDVPLEGVYVI